MPSPTTQLSTPSSIRTSTSTATPFAGPTMSPTPMTSPGARTFLSDDGLLTVDVPVGAAGDPAALAALARGADDLPPELHGLEVRSAFYELAPGGVQFVAPVTVTRRASFEDLEIDPSRGMPILLLAIRSADGAWEWLQDQTLRRDGDYVSVSGLTTHTGTVFAFGGQAFTNTEVTGGSPAVGFSVRITATLSFPDTSFDPPLLGVFEPILPGDFVQVGDADGPDNQNLSQAFTCAGQGMGLVGIRYSVLNLGAEVALFGQLGLGPASTEVETTTELTCAVAAASTP